jgi:hypothetical protein
MNRHTDQFETVLPDALRRRYQIPRGPDVVPQVTFVPGEMVTWEKIQQVCCPNPPVESPKESHWPVLGPFIAIAIVCTGIATVALLNRDTPNATPAPRVTHATLVATPTPIATPMPTPMPTPTPAPTPALTSEVRRAEPVSENPVVMPYGEVVFNVKYRGKLSSQEQLPLKGNHLGDMFKIGKDVFVWVAPDTNPGMWIDPQ